MLRGIDRQVIVQDDEDCEKYLKSYCEKYGGEIMPHNPNEEKVELKGTLAEFRDALEEEIDKIKKSGQSSTLLFAGRQIERNGADFW